MRPSAKEDDDDDDDAAVAAADDDRSQIEVDKDITLCSENQLLILQQRHKSLTNHRESDVVVVWALLGFDSKC